MRFWQFQAYTVEYLLWDYLRNGLDLMYKELNVDADLLVNEYYKLSTTGQWERVFSYILEKGRTK